MVCIRSVFLVGIEVGGARVVVLRCGAELGMSMCICVVLCFVCLRGVKMVIQHLGGLGFDLDRLGISRNGFFYKGFRKEMGPPLTHGLDPRLGSIPCARQGGIQGTHGLDPRPGCKPLELGALATSMA